MTVPAWIVNKVTKRQPLDLSHVKMIVYDEADEMYLQDTNL